MILVLSTLVCRNCKIAVRAVLLSPVVIALALTVCSICVSKAADSPSPSVGDVVPGADSPEGLAKLREQAESMKAEQYSIGKKLLDDFPDNFDSFRIMGFVHSSHGNTEDMLSCWQRCQELEPDRAEIYDQLGRHAIKVEDHEAAVEYLQTALRLDPRLPELRQNIGQAWMNMGKAEEAVTVLQQEQSQSRSPELHSLLADAFFQLQQFENAKENYAAAAKLAPNRPRAYYGLVKTCARLGLREEMAKFSKKFQAIESAIEAADQVYRKEFDDLKIMRGRLVKTCIDTGRVYGRDKQFDRAQTLWERATALDGKNTECRSLLAKLYRSQRKLSKALLHYEVLVRLEPTNTDHFHDLGFIQAQAGRLADAEMTFKQLLEIAPKKAMGHRTLAKFYLNTNRQTALAQTLAASAVKLEPVADSYFVLGWACAKNGRFADAELALQEAIRMAPKNPTYRKLYETIKRQK